MGYKTDLIVEFLLRYPLADIQTLRLVSHGWLSDNPFAKNALNKANNSIRRLIADKKLNYRTDELYSLKKKVIDTYFDIEPYYTVNGNPSVRKRLAEVSRIAASMFAKGAAYNYYQDRISFACSTVWKALNPAVSSTSRFAGVLNLCKERYAVYDVSDEFLSWHLHAEESLFTETPPERKLSLDGVIMLTTKNVLEQTIAIVGRTAKCKRLKIQKNKPYPTIGYAPLVVSRELKKVYLLSYPEFANQISNAFLYNNSEVLRRNLHRELDIEMIHANKQTEDFDFYVNGTCAYLYLINDINKLLQMLHRANNCKIAIICTEQTREIVEYFFGEKDEIYVISERKYGGEGGFFNGRNNFVSIAKVAESN